MKDMHSYRSMTHCGMAGRRCPGGTWVDQVGAAAFQAPHFDAAARWLARPPRPGQGHGSQGEALCRTKLTSLRDCMLQPPPPPPPPKTLVSLLCLGLVGLIFMPGPHTWVDLRMSSLLSVITPVQYNYVNGPKYGPPSEARSCCEKIPTTDPKTGLKFMFAYKVLPMPAPSCNSTHSLPEHCTVV